MLVGDVIQGIREAVTDLPQTLPQTSGNAVVTAAIGSTLATGTYAVVITQRNNWGETLPSAEITGLVVGANQGIQILSPLQPGATTVRAYLTLPAGAAGTEQQFIESTFAPFVISTPPPSSGVPPQRGSAYLPDTDGDAINAGTMFRWMNDALKLASQVAGGLLDYSGFGTKVNLAQYIVTGEWKRITSMWYDGYPLAMDDSGNYFRRNPITASVLASIATSLFTDRMMLEFWPQPSRTAATTTLAAPLTSFDTQATVTSTSGFLLTNGFVQIGGEFMSYATFSGTTLNNLIRGLGGTTPAAQSAGAFVGELNAFFQGWRMYAPNFQPGDAQKTIPVPVGWETALFKYGLGRAKLAEQGVGDFDKLEQSFVKQIGDWFRTNKVSTGPRQVGDVTNSLEVIPSFGGGWVVP